jgi:hypothetical protein
MWVHAKLHWIYVTSRIVRTIRRTIHQNINRTYVSGCSYVLGGLSLGFVGDVT